MTQKQYIYMIEFQVLGSSLFHNIHYTFNEGTDINDIIKLIAERNKCNQKHITLLHCGLTINEFDDKKKEVHIQSKIQSKIQEKIKPFQKKSKQEIVEEEEIEEIEKKNERTQSFIADNESDNEEEQVEEEQVEEEQVEEVEEIKVKSLKRKTTDSLPNTIKKQKK